MGTGVFFFFGGLLMILGSIGEWIIGNTFPFVVFGTFGEYLLSNHNGDTCLALPPSTILILRCRRLLGCFWRNPRPMVQRIRRLCHRSYRRSDIHGKSRQSRWFEGARFQLQLRFRPPVHGYVCFSENPRDFVPRP